MEHTKADYIEYRIGRSEEAFKDAKLLAGNESWNSCVNRLYYACFYVVSGLLLDIDIQPKTHKGIKINFLMHFVKTEKIDKNLGKFYTNLHDWRGEGDYADYVDFNKTMVFPLIAETEIFINTIKNLISEK